MSLLDILVYPDSALKLKSVPVEDVGPETDSLLDDMAQTMRAADGVGLAAPQVGRNVRILVVDVPRGEGEERDFFELLNPEIVSLSRVQSGVEEFSASLAEEGGRLQQLHNGERSRGQDGGGDGRDDSQEGQGRLAGVYCEWV